MNEIQNYIEIKKLKSKMEDYFKKTRKIQDELLKKVKYCFDFEVDITYCEGDGFLILDVDYCEVITFNVLEKKKEGIKLNRNDCFNYTI